MKKCNHKFKNKDHTIELYIEKGCIEAFCGWCGSNLKEKIKYCPLCRQKVGGKR